MPRAMRRDGTRSTTQRDHALRNHATMAATRYATLRSSLPCVVSQRTATCALHGVLPRVRCTVQCHVWSAHVARAQLLHGAE
jgi:hypothetical protein